MYLTATKIKHSGISSTFAYQISFFFGNGVVIHQEGVP